MAKEKITHSICVGGPLTVHTDLATGKIRRVRPIVLTDDDAPGWVIKAHGKEYTPQRKTTLSLLGFTEKDRTYSYDPEKGFTEGIRWIKEEYTNARGAYIDDTFYVLDTDGDITAYSLETGQETGTLH